MSEKKVKLENKNMLPPSSQKIILKLPMPSSRETVSKLLTPVSQELILKLPPLVSQEIVPELLTLDQEILKLPMPSSRETVSKLLTPVSQEIITPKLLTLGITEQTLPLIGQKTQEIMPPLGIGTYKLKGQECETMLTKALVMGYSSIDTAALYKNHSAISAAIKKSGRKRSSLFISSKIIDDAQLGFFSDAGGKWPSKSEKKSLTKDKDSDNSEAVMTASLNILRELEIDYIDLLLLHSSLPELSDNLELGNDEAAVKYLSSWRVLEKLWKQGKVRHIGVSNFRVHELERLEKDIKERKSGSKIYVNQFELSPFNTRGKLITYCQEHGILIEAFASLTVGRKLNHPLLLRLSDDLSRDLSTDLSTDLSSISVAQVLLCWALQKGYHVIPKPDTFEQLEENFKCLLLLKNCGNKLLSDEMMNQLDSLNEDFFTMPRYK
jgi:diketogulonate reductase-like aldo/keto reductase